MDTESLEIALEREHREIDAGIEGFAGDGSARVQDRAALADAIGSLRRHIYAEEELLFPPLRAAGLLGPVLVMLREHGEMWETLDSLERLLQSDDDDPVAAARRQLLRQLQNHNAKEETVLYPQAEGMLTARAVACLRAFLDSGTLPPGWTCQHMRPRHL